MLFCLSVCIPITFPFPFPSRNVCPGVLPCLFPSLPEWPRLFLSFPLFRSRDLAALVSSLSSILLLKHLRALNFHPFLALSRPVRSSSGFLYCKAASLAVFIPVSVFHFRVPLMSYSGKNERRFSVVFQISRVIFDFRFARAIIFLSFYNKITLISNRSCPFLSHPVPPTRLPALYYL